MSALSCYVGETVKIRLRVYTNADRTSYLNLTGMTLRFFASDSAVDPDVEIEKTIGSGITFESVTAGAVLITLDPADTALFGPNGGVLSFYVQLTSGADTYIISSGKIKVRRLPA